MEVASELDIGSSAESFQKFLDSQKELFHSQIDQFQTIVVKQCKLTGVNPLSQEMAAGALSINIGKKPRDLLNPKAVKYMHSVFSVKDAINKKESREISALFGLTATQVRDFFAGQRARVRKFTRQTREKAISPNTFKELEGVDTMSSDPMVPIDQVPLSSVGPLIIEDEPSCSTQDEDLPGIDDLEYHFVENIFSLMRKEETYSGQVKLMEWVLQIKNSSVLNWFLNKGGVMILATWLSQAATEEQTSVLFVILKVLCHLPLHKALPVHMSAILQSVNRLRFYRTSDISTRARVLLSRWSTLFARIQGLKKPNGMTSSSDAQKEMLLKQSIGEILADERWQSKIDKPEQGLASSFESSDDIRKPDSALKLLPASTDDLSRKHMRGVSSPQIKERRKVQLVEHPGQKTGGRSMQVARAVPVMTQSRPLSADDIQKAKMRAAMMQIKYGKSTASSSDGSSGAAMKIDGLGAKPLPSRTRVLPSASRPHLRPKVEEHKKTAIIPPSKIPNKVAPLRVALKETLGERLKRIQIPWQKPQEMVPNGLWGLGVGENSKEIEVQRNRIRREKEIVYRTFQEIPSNPKEPWDREMDYDDSLTPEIPTQQPPDPEPETELEPEPEEEPIYDQLPNTSIMVEPPRIDYDTNVTTVTATPTLTVTVTAPVAAPKVEYESGAVPLGAPTLPIVPEPDLELLAVLLRNPELVFALTSGQASNLSSEDKVRLLDIIRISETSSGGGSGGLNGLLGPRVEERVEVSLPSPTPPSNPVMTGWRDEVAKNPFSQQNSIVNNRDVHRFSAATTTTAPLPAKLPTAVAVPRDMHSYPTATTTTAPPPAKLHPATAVPPRDVYSYPAATTTTVPPPAVAVPPNASTTFTMPRVSHSNNTILRPQMVYSMQDMASTSSHIAKPPQPTLLNRRQPIMYSLSPPQMISPEPPLYAARPGGSMPGSWRTMQDFALYPHSQANDINHRRVEYNGPGFETWSPDRSPEYMLGPGPGPRPGMGRNFVEPRDSYGRSYGPERSRDRNSYGPHDYNRHENRWRDRKR